MGTGVARDGAERAHATPLVTSLPDRCRPGRPGAGAHPRKSCPGWFPDTTRRVGQRLPPRSCRQAEGAARYVPQSGSGCSRPRWPCKREWPPPEGPGKSRLIEDEAASNLRLRVAGEKALEQWLNDDNGPRKQSRLRLCTLHTRLTGLDDCRAKFTENSRRLWRFVVTNGRHDPTIRVWRQDHRAGVYLSAQSLSCSWPTGAPDGTSARPTNSRPTLANQLFSTTSYERGGQPSLL